MRTLWCSSSASGVIVASGQTFTVSKTFAMPLDDGQNDYVLQTNGAGVGSWVAQSGGGGGGAITGTTGTFTDATDSSSSTSGPLKTAGGLAVAKSLYVGTFSYFADHATFNGDVVCNDFRQNVAGDTNFTSNIIDPMLRLTPVANSVNYVTIEPNIAGSPAHIYTAGGDTDIGLHLRAKGAGYVSIEDGNTPTKRIRFLASGNSPNVTTTIESASTVNRTITLPNSTTTLAGLALAQTFAALNTFAAVTATGNIIGKAFFGGVAAQAATAAAAPIDITTNITTLTCAVAVGLMTINVGTVGQQKIIQAKALTGTVELTPLSASVKTTGWSKITFLSTPTPYGSVILVWHNATEGWMIASNYGCQITP